MIKKFKDWYDGLTPVPKNIISFILKFAYRLIAFLIAAPFLFDEKRSWTYLLFTATLMSLLMTIPFNWNQLKQIFKSQK